MALKELTVISPERAAARALGAGRARLGGPGGTAAAGRASAGGQRRATTAREDAAWASGDVCAGATGSSAHASTLPRSASTGGRVSARVSQASSGEDERQQVVHGVPGVEHAAQQQQQGECEQRLARPRRANAHPQPQRRRSSGAAPTARPAEWVIAPIHGGRRCGIRAWFRAEEAVHERAVVAQEPEHLPRLEDPRRGERSPPGGGDEAARADERRAGRAPRRDAPALSSAEHPARAESASSTGAAASSAHSLLAIARPSSTPAPADVVLGRQQHGGRRTGHAPSSSSGCPSSSART